MKTCSNCDYGHQSNVGNVRDLSGNPKDYPLECWRYPPTVQPLQRSNPMTQKMEIGTMSAYPPVQDENHCGEHKDKVKIDGKN